MIKRFTLRLDQSHEEVFLQIIQGLDFEVDIKPEEEQEKDFGVPQWQQDVVNKRIEDIEKGTATMLTFEQYKASRAKFREQLRKIRS